MAVELYYGPVLATEAMPQSVYGKLVHGPAMRDSEGLRVPPL